MDKSQETVKFEASTIQFPTSAETKQRQISIKEERMSRFSRHVAVSTEKMQRSFQRAVFNFKRTRA